MFKAGDYATIGSYLYEDVTSNSSGEADVKIEPALRQGIETIADNTLFFTNTTTVMRLDQMKQDGIQIKFLNMA